MSSNIYSITAREILDSRGNPTIETMVILESGYRAIAAIPAGASVGKYEAHELRDGDEKRYNGMGVLKAVSNVNVTIAPRLKGHDALDQSGIDKLMIDMDGTPNKGVLGANAVLSVSMATALAAAAMQRVAPYIYFNTLFSQYHKTPIKKIPTPTLNVINGGAHGAGNLDIQEFHITPASSKSFADALRMGVEIYHSIGKILQYRNAIHSVGDEGGFAPDLFTNLDAMEVLKEGIQNTPYRLGVEVFFGLDLAANHFKTERGYQIKDRPNPYSTEDFTQYLLNLHKKYRLILLEDPFEEDDLRGWKAITQAIGHEVLIVGDDLIATNLERFERAIAEKLCSAILLKPNQVGSLSEFFAVVALARKNDIDCIVSHRSGETNDTYISDLAVAVQSEYVKFGAPARGERVAKYNRLLQIESELV